MPEPVNTSSSGSKLNEFCEMQCMLIVFVVQSAAVYCPGCEAPVAMDLGTAYFRRACRSSIVDQVHCSKKSDHQGWLQNSLQSSTKLQIRNAEPVTDASYSGSLTFARTDSDLLEWSSRSRQIGLNSKV